MNKLQTCDRNEEELSLIKSYPIFLFNENLRILANLVFFRTNYIASFRIGSYFLNFDSYLKTLFFLDFLILEHVRNLYRYNFLITKLPYT